MRHDQFDHVIRAAGDILQTVIRAALVDPEVLRVRIGALPVDVTTRATIDERLARLLRP